MISWFAQGIGIIGTMLVVVSFQFRGRRLFVLQAFAAVMFMMNFGLLGAMAGMLQNVLSAVRGSLLSLETKRWTQHPSWFWFLYISYIVCGLATWENWFSLLPMIAMIVSTVAMRRKNDREIRVVQLLMVSPCWIIYSISVLSISGIATEILNIGSILLSIARFGWKRLDSTVLKNPK